MRPRYDEANASAAISRDARLARRDHAAWAAGGLCVPRTATAPTGPDVSGPIPRPAGRISATAASAVPAFKRP